MSERRAKGMIAQKHPKDEEELPIIPALTTHPQPLKTDPASAPPFNLLPDFAFK